MYHVSCVIPDFFGTGAFLYWDNDSSHVIQVVKNCLQLYQSDFTANGENQGLPKDDSPHPKIRCLR